MNLSQAITNFDTYLRADSRSPHTIRSYNYDLITLQGWLGGDPYVASIQPAQLHEFLASSLVLKKPDGSPRTKGSINKIKTVLKAFFGWLEKETVNEGNEKLIEPEITSKVPPLLEKIGEKHNVQNLNKILWK